MSFYAIDMNPFILSLSEKDVTFLLDVNQTKLLNVDGYVNISHVIRR